MKNKEYIEVEQGVKLHFTDEGTGRPIVLIHGWPQSDEIFKYQYEDLKAKGYRVIGITMRGFGKSDHPDGKYDFETFAKDLDAVINELSIEDIVLLGYSLGGLIATQYLTTYASNKVTKLVLLSSNVPLSTQLDDYPYGANKETYGYLIAGIKENREAVLSVYGPLFKLDEDFISLSEGAWLNGITSEGSEEAIIKTITSLRDVDQRSIIHKINIPTAVFHAVNDSTVPFEIAREAQRGIEGATLVRFEYGGHWIFLKEREKFNLELLSFINS